MKNLLTTSLASLAMFAFVLSGCADSTPAMPTASTPAATDGEHHAGDGHDHSEHAHHSEGPHGGDLIELGNDEYHAELVHPEDHDDDAHAHEDGDKDHKNDHSDHDHAGIVIYILDGSAKEAVAIEATDITLNLSHDGNPQQFRLTALPMESDLQSKSSRFTSDDKDLLEHFQEEGIEGALVVTIDGKSFRGKITHDHEGHGHSH
ncbi:hypothetical protein GC176_09640 [bacterium]|nr:hypothetical protein [bacterium]